MDISPPRTWRIRSSLASRMFSPNQVTEPEIAADGGRSFSRLMAVTDLPEPDSPTTATTSRGATVKSTPRTAWTTPSSVLKPTLRPCTSSRFPVSVTGTSDILHVQRISEAVTDQEEPEHREDDGEPGEDEQVRGLAEVGLRLGDRQAQRRRRRHDAHPEEAE